MYEWGKGISILLLVIDEVRSRMTTTEERFCHSISSQMILRSSRLSRNGGVFQQRERPEQRRRPSRGGNPAQLLRLRDGAHRAQEGEIGAGNH